MCVYARLVGLTVQQPANMVNNVFWIQDSTRRYKKMPTSLKILYAHNTTTIGWPQAQKFEQKAYREKKKACINHIVQKYTYDNRNIDVHKTRTPQSFLVEIKVLYKARVEACPEVRELKFRYARIRCAFPTKLRQQSPALQC